MLREWRELVEYGLELKCSIREVHKGMDNFVKSTNF